MTPPSEDVFVPMARESVAVTAIVLARDAANDWSRLIRGFADAAAPFASGAGGANTSGGRERPPAFQMCERMLLRAAKEGAQALSWAGQPLELPKFLAGAGRKHREQFAALAELATAPAEVPVSFRQVQRAFSGDEDRSAALVAMFLEAGRKAELLLEQLQLAAKADVAAPSSTSITAATPRNHKGRAKGKPATAIKPLGVRDAVELLERAMQLAHVREFRPRVGSVADFDRVRATGYAPATPGRASETVGHIAVVKRPGLEWQGHVLRKADVIVFEAAP